MVELLECGHLLLCTSFNMPLDQLLLFVSMTFFVSASPGPVMLSCMAYAGRYGFKTSLYGMLGASCGNLVLMLLSALGIGLLVEQAASIFLWVQWIGAAYLAYLGLQLFFAAPTSVETTSASIPAHHLLSRAFIIAITNPKGLLYFGALFPAFINLDKNIAPQFALLTVIFLVMDFVWMALYAQGGSTLMQWLDKPEHQRWFNRISGGMLVVAGVTMGFTKW